MNNDLHITQQEMELIEHYLKDELSETEAIAFEEKKRTDADWQQKIDEMTLLALGISEAVLQEKLNEIHKELKTHQPTTIRRKSNTKRWLAAASVIALIILSGLLFFKKPKNEKLYMAYYRPDPGLPVVMGNDTKNNYTLYDGMIGYKEGNDEKAIQKWKSIGDEKGYSDTLNYYIGIAYLHQASYPKALQYLQKVCGTQPSAYKEKATWYMALIHIKHKDWNAAKVLLSELKDIPEAKTLYQQLEE
ncbi:MAG: hypothetical protein QM610_12700 [Chitinophagaceae bacterium]